MPRARLGVALLVPPPVASEIDGLRRALGDGTLGRIPAHLTLVPPVNVSQARLDDALAVLRAAADATRPFTAELGPPATFLPDNPVLYLAVGAGAGDIHRLRDAVFVDPLARPLTWPFVPHVTVADEIDPVRIESGLVALAEYRAEVVFDRVHLLQEGPGRVWEPIADSPFAAPAVIGRGGLPLELTVSTGLDPAGAAFASREWATYSEATYGSDWAPDAGFAITARRDGRIVGVATGHTGTGGAYLARLIVDRAERSQGIGSHLLARFEALARERGCRRLRLRTLAGGEAEAFYRARGWTVDVALPRWRSDRDFVQMVRELPDH